MSMLRCAKWRRRRCVQEPGWWDNLERHRPGRGRCLLLSDRPTDHNHSVRGDQRRRSECFCYRKGFGCHYAAKVSAQVLQKLMRHGDIKTTMAYYANVDDAAEQAVRSRHCNTSRNTPAAARTRRGEPNDANHCLD